jgi:hypothetical protein
VAEGRISLASAEPGRSPIVVEQIATPNKARSVSHAIHAGKWRGRKPVEGGQSPVMLASAATNGELMEANE